MFYGLRAAPQGTITSSPRVLAAALGAKLTAGRHDGIGRQRGDRGFDDLTILATGRLYADDTPVPMLAKGGPRPGAPESMCATTGRSAGRSAGSAVPISAIG